MKATTQGILPAEMAHIQLELLLETALAKKDTRMEHIREDIGESLLLSYYHQHDWKYPS